MVQSRQKSNADLKRRQVEFDVGDHVFLKVSPTKGVVRFGKKRKLAPRSTKRLRRKEVNLVKVCWSHHDEGDASWELESDMRTKYPKLFLVNVIHAIGQSGLDLSDIGGVVDAVRNLKSEFEWILRKHVRKRKNQIAHTLARRALKMDQALFCFDSRPPWLQELIAKCHRV
ncbi:hypothetical protein ACLB2K_065929 [Fragaria x ananassa]